jgi:hypothetical protein
MAAVSQGTRARCFSRRGSSREARRTTGHHNEEESSGLRAAAPRRFGDLIPPPGKDTKSGDPTPTYVERRSGPGPRDPGPHLTGHG